MCDGGALNVLFSRVSCLCVFSSQAKPLSVITQFFHQSSPQSGNRCSNTPYLVRVNAPLNYISTTASLHTSMMKKPVADPISCHEILQSISTTRLPLAVLFFWSNSSPVPWMGNVGGRRNAIQCLRKPRRQDLPPEMLYDNYQPHPPPGNIFPFY